MFSFSSTTDLNGFHFYSGTFCHLSLGKFNYRFSILLVVHTKLLLPWVRKHDNVKIWAYTIDLYFKKHCFLDLKKTTTLDFPPLPSKSMPLLLFQTWFLWRGGAKLKQTNKNPTQVPRRFSYCYVGRSDEFSSSYGIILWSWKSEATGEKYI